MKLILTISLMMSILLGCGGGGGGTPTPTPTPTPTLAPTVSISFTSDSTEFRRGEYVALTWSSVNATSCSSSGDWSANIGLSGSDEVLLSSAGEKRFAINCSGISRTVTISVSEVFDTKVFIDDDQLFSGFFFHKVEGRAGCLTSVEAELAIADNSSLYFKSFALTELRTLGYFDSALALGDDRSNGVYSYPISSPGVSSSNVVTIRSTTVDPYDIELTSLDDLEQFSADISLDFDSVDGNDRSCWGADVAMTVLAFPRSEGGSENDAEFIGVSQTSDSYSFLYLVDNREVEANSNDLPSESDLFNIEFAMLSSFHSYKSQPNIEQNDTIFVTSDVENYSNMYVDQIIGAKRAERNYGLKPYNTTSRDYAVKYLYPLNDSNQRVFLKVSPGEYCVTSFDFGGSWICTLEDPEIIFTTPNGSSIRGFSLGGYNQKPNVTHVKLWLPNGN